MRLLNFQRDIIMGDSGNANANPNKEERTQDEWIQSILDDEKYKYELRLIESNMRHLFVGIFIGVGITLILILL